MISGLRGRVNYAVLERSVMGHCGLPSAELFLQVAWRNWHSAVERPQVGPVCKESGRQPLRCTMEPGDQSALDSGTRPEARLVGRHPGLVKPAIFCWRIAPR